MTKETLKCNNIRVNKKKFHMSKEPTDLMSVNIDQIFVSDKFNHNNNGSWYFIGYQEGEIIKPLCIILPQMTGYIKYFEYGGMNMSFLIKGKTTNKFGIWLKINWALNFIFHLFIIKKYLKTKVKEYGGVIKTNLLGNDLTRQNKHYTCIACITIDSVMRIDKKNYPQVCLEECKYEINRIQMSRFINTQLYGCWFRWWLRFRFRWFTWWFQ